MSNVVIVGAQWGDEGKGKIVDLFTSWADVVVRFQGGANAGHTLVVGGTKTVLHLVPSGVLHPGKRCFIGNGVVVDPEALSQEIDVLKSRGLLVDPTQLVVSENAHVIFSYHKIIDVGREQKEGRKKIGTTGRGIGPCYEDKVARRGIRMRDLLKPEVLR
ncbi:MAG: adenylosuccinate synthetase, partial [Myxococcales bacterium]